MGSTSVQYFFSFTSCFAALADARVDDLVAKAGAELEAFPIVLPNADPPSGLAAQTGAFKITYLVEDAARWARELGIPWNPPESFLRQRWPGDRFIDGTNATAGWYFAHDRGSERAYRNAVFEACWCYGRDIAERGVLSECAKAARLSPSEFAGALDSGRFHERISLVFEHCLRHHIFGVPAFALDGERFWGNDRLDFLARALGVGE